MMADGREAEDRGIKAKTPVATQQHSQGDGWRQDGKEREGGKTRWNRERERH